MIQVKQLTKKFGTKTIFENASLCLEEGHIYGFVGENGIGKSVFFKTISGLMAPTSGTVICNGKVIGKDIHYLEHLGYMDGDVNFIRYLTGFENLKMLASIRCIIDDDRIKQLMSQFGLDPDNADMVKNYSLGMKQKLSIIQAVMENPDTLIFDEPFNGLDKQSCAFVKEYILQLRDSRKTILLTSHILNDIEEIADIVYEFHNGTIQQRQ